MATTVGNDALTTIAKAIDDRLAKEERKKAQWETKLTNVRNALNVLNSAHKQHADAEKKFLENIKNVILRNQTAVVQDGLMSPQTPRTTNAHVFATVESDNEDEDGLVGYESGFQMGSLLRTPERSPGTVMPSDPIPSIENFSRQGDSIGLSQEREAPRQAVMIAPLPSSAGKRKRQELESVQTGALKRPRQPADSTATAGPSSMAPPPRPAQRPTSGTEIDRRDRRRTERPSALAGERKTTNLLKAFQRGERYMSQAWKEQSVPPATFCTCGRANCPICRSQKSSN